MDLRQEETQYAKDSAGGAGLGGGLNEGGGHLKFDVIFLKKNKTFNLVIG